MNAGRVPSGVPSVCKRTCSPGSPLSKNLNIEKWARPSTKKIGPNVEFKGPGLPSTSSFVDSGVPSETTSPVREHHRHGKTRSFPRNQKRSRAKPVQRPAESVRRRSDGYLPASRLSPRSLDRPLASRRESMREIPRREPPSATFCRSVEDLVDGCRRAFRPKPTRQ